MHFLVLFLNLILFVFSSSSFCFAFFILHPVSFSPPQLLSCFFLILSDILSYHALASLLTSSFSFHSLSDFSLLTCTGSRHFPSYSVTVHLLHPLQLFIPFSECLIFFFSIFPRSFSSSRAVYLAKILCVVV